MSEQSHRQHASVVVLIERALIVAAVAGLIAVVVRGFV